MQLTAQQITEKIDAVIGDIWVVRITQYGPFMVTNHNLYYDNEQEALNESHSINNSGTKYIEAGAPFKADWKSIFFLANNISNR
jgi:hypothetical protein